MENLSTATLLHQRVQKLFEKSSTRYQDLYIISNVYYNLRHKAEASYHRRGKRYEFGIPMTDWKRYVKIAEDGNRIYSVIVEAKTNTVYAALVSDLAALARMCLGEDIDKGGSVFIPREKYTVMNK